MVLTHSHAAGEKKVWMFGSRLRRSAEPDGDRDPDPEGPEPSNAAFLRAAAAKRRRAANAANAFKAFKAPKACNGAYKCLSGLH